MPFTIGAKDFVDQVDTPLIIVKGQFTVSLVASDPVQHAGQSRTLQYSVTASTATETETVRINRDAVHGVVQWSANGYATPTTCNTTMEHHVCDVGVLQFTPGTPVTVYLTFVPLPSLSGPLPVYVTFEAELFDAYMHKPYLIGIGYLTVEPHVPQTTITTGDLATAKFRVHATGDATSSFISVSNSHTGGTVWWGKTHSQVNTAPCQALAYSHRCNLTDLGETFVGNQPNDFWIFFTPAAELYGTLDLSVSFQAMYFSEPTAVVSYQVYGRILVNYVVPALGPTFAFWDQTNITVKFDVSATGPTMSNETITVDASKVDGYIGFSLTGSDWTDCALDAGATHYICNLDTRIPAQPASTSIWLSLTPHNASFGRWDGTVLFDAAGFNTTSYAPYLYIIAENTVAYSGVTPSTVGIGERSMLTMRLVGSRQSTGNEQLLVEESFVQPSAGVRWGTTNMERDSWPCDAAYGYFECNLNGRASFTPSAQTFFVWFNPRAQFAGTISGMVRAVAPFYNHLDVPTNVTVLGNLSVTSRPGAVVQGSTIAVEIAVTSSTNTTRGERVVVNASQVENGYMVWGNLTSMDHAIPCDLVGAWLECHLDVHFRHTEPTNLYFWFQPATHLLGPGDGVEFLVSAHAVSVVSHTPAYEIGTFNISEFYVHPSRYPVAGEPVVVQFSALSTSTWSQNTKVSTPVERTEGSMKWSTAMDVTKAYDCPLYKETLICDLSELSFTWERPVTIFLFFVPDTLRVGLLDLNVTLSGDYFTPTYLNPGIVVLGTVIPEFDPIWYAPSETVGPNTEMKVKFSVRSSAPSLAEYVHIENANIEGGVVKWALGGDVANPTVCEGLVCDLRTSVVFTPWRSTYVWFWFTPVGLPYGELMNFTTTWIADGFANKTVSAGIRVKDVFGLAITPQAWVMPSGTSSTDLEGHVSGSQVTVRFDVTATHNTTGGEKLTLLTDKTDGSPVWWSRNGANPENHNCTSHPLGTTICDFALEGFVFGPDEVQQIYVTFIPNKATLGLLGAEFTFLADLFTPGVAVPDILMLGRFTVFDGQTAVAPVSPRTAGLAEVTEVSFPVITTGYMNDYLRPTVSVHKDLIMADAGLMWKNASAGAWAACPLSQSSYVCEIGPTTLNPVTVTAVYLRFKPSGVMVGPYQIPVVLDAFHYVSHTYTLPLVLLGNFKLESEWISDMNPKAGNGVTIHYIIQASTATVGGEQLSLSVAAHTGASYLHEDTEERFSAVCQNPFNGSGIAVCAFPGSPFRGAHHHSNLYLHFTPNTGAIGAMTTGPQLQASYFEEMELVPRVSVTGVFNMKVELYPWPLVPSGMNITMVYWILSTSQTAGGEKLRIPSAAITGELFWAPAAATNNSNISHDMYGCSIDPLDNAFVCDLVNVTFDARDWTPIWLYFLPLTTTVGPWEATVTVQADGFADGVDHPPLYVFGLNTLSSVTALQSVVEWGNFAQVKYVLTSTGPARQQDRVVIAASKVVGSSGVFWGLVPDFSLAVPCYLNVDEYICYLSSDGGNSHWTTQTFTVYTWCVLSRLLCVACFSLGQS